jgi:hypothetical protein
VWEDPDSNDETERRGYTMSGHITTLSFTPHGPSPSLMHNVDTVNNTKPTWTAINSDFYIEGGFGTPDQTLDSTNECLPYLHRKMNPTASEPFRGTFSVSEEEKYPHAHAGIPTSTPRKYVYKPSIKFMAPQMKDCGLIRSGQSAHLNVSCQSGKYATDSARGKCPPPSLKPLSDLQIAFTDVSLMHPSDESISRPRSQPENPGSSPPNSRFVTVNGTILSGGPATAPIANRKLLLSPIIAATARRSFPQSQPATPRPATKGKQAISAKSYYSTTSSFEERFIPSACAIICSCRKPAETFSKKIVECLNPDCRVGWYHYTCLNKSAKLSSLHGKWTCQWCKAEDQWITVNGLTDMKSPFSAKDMINALDLPVGVAIHANPYGLGKAEPDILTLAQKRGVTFIPSQREDEVEANDTSVGTHSHTFTPGALAHFGYTSSYPPWICHAYGDGNTYVEEDVYDDNDGDYGENEYDDNYDYVDEDVHGNEDAGTI